MRTKTIAFFLFICLFCAVLMTGSFNLVHGYNQLMLIENRVASMGETILDTVFPMRGKTEFKLIVLNPYNGEHDEVYGYKPSVTGFILTRKYLDYDVGTYFQYVGSPLHPNDTWYLRTNKIFNNLYFHIFEEMEIEY